MKTVESRHTAGEWTIKSLKDTNGHCGWSIVSGVNSIATVYAGVVYSPRKQGQLAKDPHNTESIANAHLIASAPDLLEACRLAHTALACILDVKDQFGAPAASPRWIKTREAIATAIAKALATNNSTKE